MTSPRERFCPSALTRSIPDLTFDVLVFDVLDDSNFFNHHGMPNNLDAKSFDDLISNTKKAHPYFRPAVNFSPPFSPLPMYSN